MDEDVLDIIKNDSARMFAPHVFATGSVFLYPHAAVEQGIVFLLVWVALSIILVWQSLGRGEEAVAAAVLCAALLMGGGVFESGLSGRAEPLRARSAKTLSGEKRVALGKHARHAAVE